MVVHPLCPPRLEHVTGLLPERKLVGVVRLREEYGMPLNALDVHCDPKCLDMRGYLAELRELVGGVKFLRCGVLPVGPVTRFRTFGEWPIILDL